MLESITAPLTNENKEQPPIFNTKVFNETAKHITERLSDDPDFQFCFNKLYQNTLRHYVISGDSTVGKYDTCWVKIPTSDPQKEEFKQNVKKLKILSHRSWCTKSTHAKTYLSMGDFYIYYDNGQPKACIRTENDNVAEIVYENNFDLSDKYINEVLNFIDKENLSTDKFDMVLLGGKFKQYKNDFS